MCSSDLIRNGYTVKVLNKTRSNEHYTLVVEGISGARLAVVGDGEVGADGTDAVLDVKPDAVGTFRVTVRAERKVLSGESTPIRFRIAGTASNAVQSSIFMGPKP